MKISQISKINIPLLIIAIISISAFAATKAYFTASQDSPENIFVSGTLNLEIQQDSVLSVTNWKPGDVNTLEFTVENTGNLPVYVKGYLDGQWTNTALDPNLFEIIGIDVHNNDIWVQLTNAMQIGDEFFVSSSGTENDLFIIEPQQSVEVSITTQLSETTPDEYQNQEFTASLHIAGKQVIEGAGWPAQY